MVDVLLGIGFGLIGFGVLVWGVLLIDRWCW